jgi:GT2 family glycosyltransferase
MSYSVGVVLLTMGNRPTEFGQALESVLTQQGVELDVVVVGNGWTPTDLPAGVKAHALPINVGIPAGRNAGVPQVSGDYLFFLDDDAKLPESNTLVSLIDLMHGSDIGLIQPRVIDPTGAKSPDRWVPRIKAGDHSVSAEATSLWEGAVLIRRAVFDQIGGWGEPYFYAHEGIELCWRVWATGHRVWYAGDIAVHHPAINPERHEDFWFKNARNRVWLAKRNLPILLAIIYPTTWVLITLGKVRNLRSLRAWLAGWVNGWVTNPGGRAPMSWRTALRLGKAGRFPIV